VYARQIAGEDAALIVIRREEAIERSLRRIEARSKN
jgi:hypothetical protein